jgi:hypothetical protein
MTVTPSEFENAHMLAPLGDDLEARIDRAEALLSVFFSAAVVGGSSFANASVIVGSFAPKEIFLPVPSRPTVNVALHPYRSEEWAEAQQARVMICEPNRYD